ncbi:MAG: EAL domain-containing protein [Mariprofundaceae bacterium]
MNTVASKNNNLALLKKRATLPAIYGAIIACSSVVIATIAVTYFTDGTIHLTAIIEAQKTNPALWILNCMPFIFAFWGQFVGSVIAKEAGSILIDETHALWNQTQLLRDQVEQQTNYDTLTQLPNRHSLCNSINTLMKTESSNKNPVIIIMDIDAFKEINNALGPKKGDFILKQIAYRLSKALEKSNIIIARIGGDEFAVLLPRQNNKNTITKFISKLQNNLKQAIVLDGLSVSVEASFGIAIAPQDGKTAEELLRHAEVAMHVCKREKQGHAFYSSKMEINNLGNLVLKTEIHRALESDELCLHFQPKIGKNNEAQEVEALVRWNHPEKGMVFPDQFIPIIEEKRLNKELLECILLLALKQAQAWKKKDIHIRIAINLTAFDLLDPGLPEMIAKMLKDFDLTSDILKLEITEGTLIENQKLTLKTLTKLSEMGIKTSIDDFGTGYSSLAYLSSLPVDEVKIDRAFVMDMLKNDRNNKIVQAIIALAHSLELHTVAEGIEDKNTLDELKGMDCDFLQGYHISKPLDAESFDVWLENWNQQS